MRSCHLVEAVAIQFEYGLQSLQLYCPQPAALAFLKEESAAKKAGAESADKDAFVLDRSSIELDFSLSQKPYSICINAVQMLATKRPVFFKDSATCLARRSMDPPGGAAGAAEGALTRTAVTGLRTHLRSSCLTLLRNYLSVTSGGHGILVKALGAAGMGAQADRALQSSRRQLDLMQGGRAARNRAAVFYEWDHSVDNSRAAKRQRDTDDAVSRVRAAKVARGLGAGIQLPASMVDACELALLNLGNLPAKRPPAVGGVRRKQAVTLDIIVDAIVTHGASLLIDENHWYDRDGGDAWTMEEGEVGEDGKKALTFAMNSKVLEAAKKSTKGVALADTEKAFVEQSKLAASQAFSRVLRATSNARSEAAADLGKQLAARLAWTLKGVKPASDIEKANEMAVEALEASLKRNAESEETLAGALEFALDYPLVSSCLAYDLVPNGPASQPRDEATTSSTASLSMRVLNEAYICSLNANKENYENALDIFVSAGANSSDLSNKMPSDGEKKRIANAAASLLPHQIGAAPSVTRTSLSLVGALCDIDVFPAKSSKQSIAEAAALHASKAAAEKRATAALLILRDVVFYRDAMRGAAVDCAVSIAAGRLPASLPIEDKALKLVMNVIFPKNADCADKVVESATKELEVAMQLSIDSRDKISKANAANSKKKERPRHGAKAALLPQSDEEKFVLDRVRKPVVLFMALCVRRPEIIKAIMEMSCREGADVLAKAVKTNMPKLTKAVALKYGETCSCALIFMFDTGPLSLCPSTTFFIHSKECASCYT